MCSMFWFGKDNNSGNSNDMKNFEFYRANVLAQYIINKCVTEDVPISNLQLQKILYFIQFNFFRNFNSPAFLDKIEAWQHGPVVPCVYDEFAYMAGNPIIREFNVDTNIFIHNVDRALVDRIVETCRILKPWDLVELTHKKGSPWEQVYEEGKRNEITLQIIAEYAKERRLHGK